MLMYLIEITAQTRDDDTHTTVDGLYSALILAGQNGLAPNGYRVIEYDGGSGGDLRSGSKAVLRSAAGETTYDTLAEAQLAASELDASAGYQIIDLEQPIGSAPSIIIEARPDLSSQDGVIAHRRNGWERDDADRW